ncbi:MAG: 1-(5-phosphoribosyl)-5-[(5-phosphoribosylamino)methylideneamino]imidazole-4-carboxamide isomerase [Acidimicrobiales bacterium]|nr:1-(5-phosphoribosyl)-5-[(5-phosphoribosylamino)methylideneamino]imidazole-4-carboxamide isomerase [Acidimicrobiales bacterium]
MILYPAIDLLDGACVRLFKGDYSQATTYNSEPVAQAVQFAEEGAEWIHMVDLNAARSGTAENGKAIAAVCAAVSVPVQVGGGVRSVARAAALAEAGVARVVIGTAAVENPDLVAEVAQRQAVAVGLDARDGMIATHGWTETTGISVAEAAQRFADVGIHAIVATDIARDGTMTGPDTSGLTELLGQIEVPVIASGGVGSLDDLLTLAELRSEGDGAGRRLEGVITGKAIYEGAFTVGRALAALAEVKR